MIFRDKIDVVVNKYAAKIAIVCREYEKGITFKDLDRHANSIVNGLRAEGLEKGEKIALLCGNCHHYREMFWVAAKGGFVLVPINTRWQPQEILQIIDNSEAASLVISSEFKAAVDAVKKDLRCVRRFFCVDAAIEGFRGLDAFTRNSSAEPAGITLSEDDLLWFQYTSGTTGMPKGAMLTQGIASAIIDICCPTLWRKGLFGENSRALQLLPSYSFAGIAFDLMYQWIGAPTVIMEKFDPSKMMALIEAHKITDCHIVPVILSFLLNSPDFGRYDLSSLQCVTYGGSPMAPELLKKGLEKIGPVFMQDYGCSEAGALTFLDIEDHVLEGPPEKTRRLSSCGKPIAEVDVKVLNENGQPVEPDEIGELTTRSDMVMKGYWKMPEETAQVLKDGRFYTGDLCTVDEQGYIYIKDRKKDMIISGGFNIYPYEIESVLAAHPAVQDVAVIGIPDELWGEAVCALVKYRRDAKVDEKEIIDWTRQHLAGYKKPKVVVAVDEIPRTATGKILKRELRAQYWKNRDRRV